MKDLPYLLQIPEHTGKGCKWCREVRRHIVRDEQKQFGSVLKALTVISIVIAGWLWALRQLP